MSEIWIDFVGARQAEHTLRTAIREMESQLEQLDRLKRTMGDDVLSRGNLRYRLEEACRETEKLIEKARGLAELMDKGSGRYQAVDIWLRHHIPESI